MAAKKFCCKDLEDSTDIGYSEQLDAVILFSDYGNQKINFCPWCGKKL